MRILNLFIAFILAIGLAMLVVLALPGDEIRVAHG